MMSNKFFKTLAVFFGRDLFNKIYVLNNDEKVIWNNVVSKANDGFTEWFKQTKGDDICGPWIKDITPEEIRLIDKIHSKFNKDWWWAMPISQAQICYIQFEQIKNKVIW
jgi:hypothetical protein